MNNKQIAEQVFATHFQMELGGVIDKDVQTAVEEKTKQYREKDELGRAMMYVSEVSDFEHFKRKTAAFITGEYVAMIKTLNVYDKLPGAYARQTMPFFNNAFFDFDKGAATAVGRYLKDALMYVTEDADAKYDAGKSEHLANYIMQAIVERSKSRFFVALRKDDMRLAKFKRVLSDYCKLVWTMYMTEEKTITADMPLADRIMHRNEYAKAQVERFLDDNFHVKRDAKLKTDVLYKAYEQWVCESDGEILGRTTLIKTITELLPEVMQISFRGKAYVKGLRIAG